VLSGTYRFEGANVRVTVNLLRVADGVTLWTETFSMQSGTGLELENGIALRTARLLSQKIAEIAEEKSIARQARNPEAAQHYLSARKIWRADELHRRKEIVRLFEKTIALEPAWGLVYAGYGEALLATDQLLVDWEKAEQNAGKALALDRTLAQPYAIRGEISHWRDWNWEKAESEYKQAVALDPDYAPIRYKYSKLLVIQRQ
jgi:adenylate cyclase